MGKNILRHIFLLFSQTRQHSEYICFLCACGLPRAYGLKIAKNTLSSNTLSFDHRQ